MHYASPPSRRVMWGFPGARRLPIYPLNTPSVTPASPLWRGPGKLVEPLLPDPLRRVPRFFWAYRHPLDWGKIQGRIRAPLARHREVGGGRTTASIVIFVTVGAPVRECLPLSRALPPRLKPY
ncbi:unnamed protein product [Chrysodeixis includens]|uniref:Uncharacterized protein n=1 Tax=Chrysodeixis includens TaxID=689277 RepID=A0A9N8Q241_CHRIL|nr:unnamed protein product [Chrysodeixis includens]